MTHNKAPQARLSTVAKFPKGYFLENLVVREDNSFLVSVLNHSEVWYVPPSIDGAMVDPVLFHAFGTEVASGIAEVEPNVFLMLVGDFYQGQDSHICKFDLRNWHPGKPAPPEVFCWFPPEAKALNGCCLVAPGILLATDSFAGVIWQVDFRDGARPAAIREWKAHDSMDYYSGKMKPEQPGVNAIRYAAETHHVYYTATAKKLLMRIAIDPETFEPAGDPELVVAGRMGDDFFIDEAASVIYLTTHRQNTIDVVSMDPGLNSGFTQSVAGDPVTDALIGPSSGAWGRQPGEIGRTAFVITDGGTASPEPDGQHAATLVRVDLRPIKGPFPGSE